MHFVAQSQVHSKGSAIYIEDQPEVIGNGGELPIKFLQKPTQGHTGDFGNTHSITLIQDSLEAMRLLKMMTPNLSLTQANNILSSVSNSYATRRITQTALESNPNAVNAENNVISKLITNIGNILDPGIQSETLIYSNKINGFADLTTKNNLHAEINILKTKISQNSNLQFISLDIYTENENNNINNMVTKALQNDSEGDAWKEAY